MKTPSPKSTSNRLPRGMAKVADADEAMRQAARCYGLMVIKNLAEIAENGRNEAARVSAGKELLDRGFGKNHLHIQQEAPAGSEIQVIFGPPNDTQAMLEAQHPRAMQNGTEEPT